MKQKAPWTDFSDKPIYEGDTILHPSGQKGVVVRTGEKHPSDDWRVFYADTNELLRLCLQVGDKGMGIVFRNGSGFFELAPDDKYCSVCDDIETRAVVTIKGKATCGYCGHEVSLCIPHLEQMLKGVIAFGVIYGTKRNGG